MNRYVFYHYFIVCFTNLMLLVPYRLIADRFDGSVMALLISPIFGGIMLYMFTTGLSAFPNEGFPEIFSHFYPRWLVRIIMVYKAVVILVSSTIVIASYAVIITRFLNPEGNPYVLVAVLMIICGFGATRSTVTINFILEIMLILNIPFIAFIKYKTMSNPLMNWDAVIIIAKHYNKLPSLLVFASAAFVFTGFLNLTIFNRVLPPNFRFKYRWVFPILAFLILAVTFFIPIGIHGTEAVSHYVYIWSATADSTKMMYGFIERMLFIFLVVLINLCLTFTMIGWHMALEFLRSIFPKNIVDPDEPKPPTRSYVIICVIMVATFLVMFIINERNTIYFGGLFLIMRMFSEVIFTVWVFLLSKKKVRKYENKIST